MEERERKKRKKEGQVRVAQKPGRGSKKSFPKVEEFKRIDCTSGSANKINGCKATQFSPLFLGPCDDKDGNECVTFGKF